MRRVAPLLLGCTALAALIVPAAPMARSAGQPLAAGGLSDDETSSGPVVARRDFQIQYRLEGRTAPSERVGLVSNQRLTLEPSVANGDTIAAGQLVGGASIDPDVLAELRGRAEVSNIDAGQLERLSGLEGDVVSPVAGVFDAANASIVRAGIDVAVDLSPVQALRYESLRFTGKASVETIAGQREIACEAVWLEPAAPGDADWGSGGSGRRLRCRLPAFVETAPGIPATLTLLSELLPDAVVVPNVFVGYDGASDTYYVNVWRDGTDAEPTRFDVTVGVTDGVVRVVTSELPVGAALAPAAAGDG